MFCIAAFIVFSVLAIFSASFRPLAAKAWHCVLLRVTFRPCDISFGEEMKGKLVGKLIFTHPRLARFLSRWIDWLSFAFVILSIWSLLYVGNAGLNLWVYDTCSPSNVESCSLSGEACGVETESLGFFRAVSEDRFGEWFFGPFVRFVETVSRIPDRLRSWDAKEFLGQTATFYHEVDLTKPYVLEIIDPSCKFCKKLTAHLEEAGIFDRTNVSYLLYPIPLAGTNGYKFPHSYLMASYIEATKDVSLSHGDKTVSADWQLLKKIFKSGNGGSVEIQEMFVMGFTALEAEKKLQSLLAEIGFQPQEVERISQLSRSKSIQERLDAQKVIVEQKIRTVKIPTLLFAGRRYDRVISIEKLQSTVLR